MVIVGLGNPGKEYEKTPHNVGFMMIDEIAKANNINFLLEKKHEALIGTGYIKGEKCYLIKPLTYMNLSGKAVRSFIEYYKIPIEDVIVIYDDLDLPPGKIRLREKGSSGGQKGIQNIINLLHTDEIQRIRVGTGKANIPVVDYVLAKPSSEEIPLLDEAKNRAADAVETFIRFGFEKAKAKYF